MKKHCLNCDREFKTYLSELKKGKGKYCSRLCSNTRCNKAEVWNKGKTGVYSKETIFLMVANRKVYRGKEHKSWNNYPTYSGIHQWINRTLGKPKECTRCNFTSDNSRQFHWANISGNYLRDITDWARLCVSCHFKMDKIHERGWATKKRLS